MITSLRRAEAGCAVLIAMGFVLTGCGDGTRTWPVEVPPGWTETPAAAPPAPCGMTIDFEGHPYTGHWVEKVVLGARVGQAVAAPCVNPLQADHAAYAGDAISEPVPGPPFDVYGIDGAGPDDALVSVAQDRGGGYWIWVDSRRGFVEQGTDGVIEHLEIMGSGG